MKARKIGRIVALSTTMVLAVYIFLRMPEHPTARMVGGTSILAWYILTGLVTRRVMREILK